MATKKPVVDETVVDETNPIQPWETPGSVKIIALYHKMRHPVTDVMFQTTVAQEINDLQAPEHKFVRDQLEAKIFKIV